MSTSASEGEDRDASGLLAGVFAAARSGNLDLAYRLASAAVEGGVRDAVLFEVIARWMAQHEPDQESATALQTLRMLSAGRPALLVRLGLLCLRLRQPQAALSMFDAAISLQPDNAQAHYQRGVALGALGQVDEMRTAHAYVISLDPANAEALASLALIAARAGDTKLARDYAGKSLRCQPDEGCALAALAVADARDGRTDAAQSRIENLLSDNRCINDTRIDIAISDAGDAFTRHARFAEAFAAYAAVGERRRRRQLPAVQSRRAIDAIHRRTAYFNLSTHWGNETGETELSPASAHVFLLGFMRSGTTLLETILAANPDICAMDERELLAAAARRFLFSDETLDELGTNTGPELDTWRKDYWRAVEDTGLSPSGRALIDKMPFNSLRIPLIARLFPHARIVLAIRDPRDVVLSCFRNRFDANQLTFEFLRLEDCANFYAATMEFLEICRLKMPLSIYEHKYEDLIADFDCSVRRICEFIGVEWRESMRDFIAASDVIAPRNYSGTQVRSGFYSHGVGQWRRFSAQLSPVIPILAPWISRFGYPAD
jgi:tetratricopeptide (TPR) repeat protein